MVFGGSRAAAKALVVVLACAAAVPWSGAMAVAEEPGGQAPGPSAQEDVLQAGQVDVTGDGNLDTVTLTGLRTDTDSPYYPQLVLTVAASDHSPLTVRLEGGYSPQLQFCDFNGDHLPEVMVSSETGGSGGLTNHAIYSFKQYKAAAMPVPKPLYVSAAFKNRYQVKLNIDATGKFYKIDISDKQADYEKFGIYKKGKLVKPFIVDAHPYGSLQPIDLDKDGVCEIEGIQRISGIANADTLGYVRSVWKWKDGGWRLISSRIDKTL